MKSAFLALACAAGALAACADTGGSQQAASATAAATPAAYSAPAGGNASCFRTSDIRNHTIGDDHTLYLGMLNKDVYRLTMSGACLAGAWDTDPLIMREVTGTQVVCHPIDLDLAIRHNGPGGFSTPCIVASMEKMTPAEVAALPPKKRPF